MPFGLMQERGREARQEAGERQLLMLSADAIRPNPYQPRRTFDEAGLEELKRSIAEAGLIQPLVVRRTKGGYELIAGERRLRACRMLGMGEIPCVVQPGTGELDSALMALIENVQRRDLHFFEEAECYRAVLNTYHMTQETLAKRMGKSQSFLANQLRLLHLSPAVRKRMTEAGLTERHARALLALRDERMQLDAAQRIVERGLTVKETERMVERMNAEAPLQSKPRLLRLYRDYRLFVNAVKQSARQLTDTGIRVELVQTDLPEGVDLLVKVRQP